MYIKNQVDATLQTCPRETRQPCDDDNDGLDLRPQRPRGQTALPPMTWGKLHGMFARYM